MVGSLTKITTKILAFVKTNVYLCILKYIKMDEYKVGDFGEVHIVLEKNGIHGGVTCTGTIQIVERKYVLFKDNDGYPYLIDKKDFNFRKLVKKV